jgi:hypothetical protein
MRGGDRCGSYLSKAHRRDMKSHVGQEPLSSLVAKQIPSTRFGSSLGVARSSGRPTTGGHGCPDISFNLPEGHSEQSAPAITHL